MTCTWEISTGPAEPGSPQEFPDAAAAAADEAAWASAATEEEKRYEALFAKEAEVPLPRLTIVILVVGTYGDVAPFCALGQQLAKDGHRVRLASHSEYRKKVWLPVDRCTAAAIRVTQTKQTQRALARQTGRSAKCPQRTIAHIFTCAPRSYGGRTATETWFVADC